jgi:hypothetical protein
LLSLECFLSSNLLCFLGFLFSLLGSFFLNLGFLGSFLSSSFSLLNFHIKSGLLILGLLFSLGFWISFFNISLL